MANKTKKKGSSGVFFIGAALGALAGAVTGILTAPKSGKETRADIEREGKKALNTAKKNLDETTKKINRQFGGKKQKTTPKK